MKTAILIFLLSLCVGGCSTWAGVKADTNAAVAGTKDAATPTPDPVEVQSLLDKLVLVDGPAAIARAQKEIDNPKTSPEGVIYAQKRIICYQTVIDIAPNFHLLNAPGISGDSAGVLDRFEIVAETVEGAKSVAGVGLPPVDKAKFETACGWIKQRSEVIAVGLGLKIGSFGSGLGFLLPK